MPNNEVSGACMSKRNELIGIQMLRGFCSIAVVLDHCSGMIASPKYGGHRLFGGALEHGFLGVDIFFAVSGFIISVTTLRGASLDPAMSLPTFAEKRITRIIPLMWIGILSYAAMQFAFVRTGIDYGGYARALFLVPYSYLKPDVIWTLRQEFVFYCVFGLSFFGPRALRWCVLLWCAAPFAYVATLGSWTTPTAFIDTFPSIVFSACNIELTLGLLVGLWWVRTSPESNLRLGLHPFLLIGLGVATIVALGAGFQLVGQTMPTVLIIGVLGAALVGFSALCAIPAGLLTRIGRLLGDASYSIYLFHSHVLVVILTLYAKLGIGLAPHVVLFATALAAIASGVILHLLLEKPLIAGTRVLLARHGGWLAYRTPTPRESLPWRDGR
jgi:exopolysaccharide production protein ExoZ